MVTLCQNILRMLNYSGLSCRQFHFYFHKYNSEAFHFMLHCKKRHINITLQKLTGQITCFLNFIYSRDEESMSSVTRHRTRTLSVTSAGSALSCSTIPPVSATCASCWGQSCGQSGDLWVLSGFQVIQIFGSHMLML